MAMVAKMDRGHVATSIAAADFVLMEELSHVIARFKRAIQ